MSDAEEDICSNILGTKQDFCSKNLYVKQEFSSNIVGAKQDFCSNILDAKQDFCSKQVMTEGLDRTWQNHVVSQNVHFNLAMPCLASND